MFGPAQREMDRMLDDFFGIGSRGELPTTNGAWLAPLTLWEDGERFFVEVELPGVHAADVDASIENGTLRIVAERRAAEGEGRKYWHEERRYGSVVRTVALPETVDAESIEADLHDGVLSLTLAKRPEAKPKRIEVKVR
jgi:HSP20 family protein